MKFGKTIKIFLIDGDPNGRLHCELSNWSGKSYKIPRIKVKECVDREDLSGTGVYILFGKNDEGNDQAYIGEAENTLRRLNQQLITKEFWNETIVFISKDDNLNKAHIKYLENRLYDIAKSANRYVIENPTIPTQSSISESDKAEMEEFIDNVKMLVNTLGHKIFDEKREHEQKQKQEIFFIKGARGADGQGQPTSEGFVVFKGTKAAVITVPSISPSFEKLRTKLITDGILLKNNEFYEFSEDYIFSSPSTAAVVIMGRNANGLTEWRQKDGKSIKDFETNQNLLQE